MNISPTGYWNCGKEPHGFDQPLADAILKFFHEHHSFSAYDFGCGSGAYTDYLGDRGIWCSGFDGNPNTGTFSARCHVAELTEPVPIVTPVDIGISLEVGEHIPEKFESQFLENVTHWAEKYVILSWFPHKGEGIGHINERSNAYVQERMSERGFEFMPMETDSLRLAATLWWFKISVMCFRRKAPNDT